MESEVIVQSIPFGHVCELSKLLKCFRCVSDLNLSLPSQIGKILFFGATRKHESLLHRGLVERGNI